MAVLDRVLLDLSQMSHAAVLSIGDAGRTSKEMLVVYEYME
jgi:hypothetical protein